MTVWREAASFASLSTDALGSSVARIGADGAAPLLAVVGHIDEIGLVITHVDEKGFLYFAPIGGWDSQILIGQRVQVQAKTGAVPGVVGRKPIHLLKEEQRKKVVELRDMHIDIGAADEEEALSKVRVGDPVVIAADPVRLAGGRLVSRSLDNRLGAYVALEALRRVHERGGLKGQMAARGGCPGGDRLKGSGDDCVFAPARPGAGHRRHPCDRRAGGRGKGARPPSAGLRAGHRPRLDALAADLRAFVRDRRAPRRPLQRRGIGSRHLDRRGRDSDRPCAGSRPG